MEFPCFHPPSGIPLHLFSAESVSTTSAFRSSHRICDCHVSSSQRSHWPSDHQFLLTAILVRFLPDEIPVDSPCLDNIRSGFCFIFINGSFLFFRKYPDRCKSPVASAVKRKKIQVVGSTAKDTLSISVLCPPFIWDTINILLPAQERFCLFNTLGIRHCVHF